jgi:Ni,Fe-hydrogenase III small subunit
MEKPEEIQKAIIKEIRVPGCPPEPGVILKALLKYNHAE